MFFGEIWATRRPKSAHDCRRTCARLCHAAGGALEQIQFLLGHVSVETTERYPGCKQGRHNAVNDKSGSNHEAHLPISHISFHTAVKPFRASDFTRANSLKCQRLTFRDQPSRAAQFAVGTFSTWSITRTSVERRLNSAFSPSGSRALLTAGVPSTRLPGPGVE